jgi:hypothetical protein
MMADNRRTFTLPSDFDDDTLFAVDGRGRRSGHGISLAQQTRNPAVPFAVRALPR